MFSAKYRKLFVLTTIAMLILVAVLFWNSSPFTVSAQTTPTITVGSGTGYVNSTQVTLTLSAVNATQMQFLNDGSTWSSWEPYATTKNWTLLDGDGSKTVYVQFQDSSQQTSSVSAQVILDTTPPLPYPYYEWVSIENRTISFDGSSSIDNSPIRFFWSFGDGATATGYTVTHTYAALGNYSAYLTVTDIAGNSATQPFTVYVLTASAFVTSTPTPASTQNPIATPTVTPMVSTTTQPSTEPGIYLSAVTLMILAGVVFLIILVVLLVFILRRRPITRL